MNHLRAILLLTLLYLALTANFALNNIVMGLLLAAGVTALIRPSRRRLDGKAMGTAVIALAEYILILGRDLIISGFQVAEIILLNKPINPAIIAIPSEESDGLSVALNAHAITLTPGELVVEIGKNGVLYTHVLDADHAAEAMAAGIEKRQMLLRRIL